MKNQETIKAKLGSAHAQKSRFVFVFTVPVLLLFTLFVLVPTVQGLYYSLFDWSGLTSNMTFVGLQNYGRLLFKDPVVWLALWNDVKIALARASAYQNARICKRLFPQYFLLPGRALRCCDLHGLDDDV